MSASPEPRWSNTVKATFNACLCSKATSDSDDQRDRQQGAASSSTGPTATGGRQIFARGELEGLLASASSDEDADAMSLHSNVGGNKRNRRKKGKGKKKLRDAWGVVGRSVNNEEDDATREGRRTRTLSSATHDEDAAPLDSSDIASPVTEEEERKKNLDLMRANFEPEVTSEDLEREERELAEQEEAAAVAALSTSAGRRGGGSASTICRRRPNSHHGRYTCDRNVLSNLTPYTPLPNPPHSILSPPPTPAATSTPQSHADRIKKAAKEQRRRMREEAARLKQEAIERRAEAAAGGFGPEEPQLEQQHPQEFGEFVVGQHGGVGVAWTESDGASSHPSPHYQQQPPPPLPAMHIPIA
ncbi:hypothetical protein FRC01_005615 [Tulasnella sp. 417]|nr:hypothetical protein FRC01_005615 [Tulasnella sp. 417]